MPERETFSVLTSVPTQTSIPFDPGTRLPSFIAAPLDAPKSLAGLYLAVIGVGSIGLNLAVHATRLGVRGLLFCDPRSFKRESLLTHPLLSRSAVGKKKAAYAARLCQEINPALQVAVFDGQVQKLPLDAIAAVDAILVATDNLAAEVAAGQLSLKFKKPLLHCSVHGESLVAHAKLLDLACADAPCPACLFTEAEMRQLHAEMRFSCDGSSAAAITSPLTAAVQPTLSPSCLCSTSASLGMTMLLKHHLRLGGPVANMQWEHCGYTNRSVTTELRRRADCPCDHAPFALAPLGRPVGECSFRDLAEAAGHPQASSWAGISFGIDELRWLEKACCHCPEPRAIRRFERAGRSVAGRCSRCHQPILAQPFYSHRAVPAPLVRTLFDKPLRSLGAAKARWAIVREGENSVFLHHQTTTRGNL